MVAATMNAAELFLRRQLKLRHLRLLLAIEDARTITGAASLLGVSQVAASKTLAEIEAGLGSRLFERRRSGLVPTEFCLRMLDTSRRIDREIDCLGEELLMVNDGLKGRVRIGLQTQSAQPFLTRAIVEFKRAYPLITLELTLGSPPELEADLVRGLLNFILGPQSIANGTTGLASDPIPAEKAVVVTARADDDGNASLPPSWKDLVEHVWCLPPTGKPLRNLFDAIIAREGLDPPSSLIEMPPTFLAERIVRDSGFYMLVPGSVGQQWANRGGVRLVDIDIPLAEEAMGLIWPDGPMTPASRMFLSFVRSEIKSERERAALP